MPTYPNQQLENSLSNIFKLSRFQDQLALIVNQHIPKNTIICTFETTDILIKPDKYSIQISENKHAYMSPDILAYINHSCDPNVFIDSENKNIVSIKDIKISEQVTFFYPSTEWYMASKFDCHCGSKNCLRYIGGASQINSSVLQQYRLSTHITQMLQQA